MGHTFYLLSAALLVGQDMNQPYGSPAPPHQDLWTCSSSLRWRNTMNCHTVGEVSLPVLDCLGRFCSFFHRKPPQDLTYIYGNPVSPLQGSPASLPLGTVEEANQQEKSLR